MSQKTHAESTPCGRLSSEKPSGRKQRGAPGPEEGVPRTLPCPPPSSVLSGAPAPAHLLTAGASSSPALVPGVTSTSCEPLTLCGAHIICIPLVALVLNAADFEEIVKSASVRPEYVDFLEEWLQCGQKGQYEKILLGSPGIDKSVCSYLAVKCMLRQPDCC